MIFDKRVFEVFMDTLLMSLCRLHRSVFVTAFVCPAHFAKTKQSLVRSSYHFSNLTEPFALTPSFGVYAVIQLIACSIGITSFRIDLAPVEPSITVFFAILKVRTFPFFVLPGALNRRVFDNFSFDSGLKISKYFRRYFEPFNLDCRFR